LGSLPANRQTAHVPQPTVTLYDLQPLEVQTNLTPQIAFDHVLAFLDRMRYLRQLLFRQVLGTDAPVNPRSLKYLFRVRRAYPVNVPERDVNSLVTRYVNPKYSSHITDS